MVRNSKQKWEVGHTALPTPGDHAPDAYLLSNVAGTLIGHRAVTTFWCDDCGRPVVPTSHSVTESSTFWGHRSWHAYEELRCPLCCDVVREEIACVGCKEALPESGHDHCAACLEAIETPAFEPVRLAVGAP